MHHRHLQDRTAVFQDDVDLALLLVVEDLDQSHDVLVAERSEQPAWWWQVNSIKNILNLNQMDFINS